MSSMTSWTPRRSLVRGRDLFEEMDRLFDQPFALLRRPFAGNLPEMGGFSLDVGEENDKYVVKASLPGMNPDDIEVTLTDNLLTIKGEMKQDEDIREENYFLRERYVGAFSRSISLPSAVEADNIEAAYDQGVLVLRLPKSEAVRAKRISVGSAGGRQQHIIDQPRSTANDGPSRTDKR